MGLKFGQKPRAFKFGDRGMLLIDPDPLTFRLINLMEAMATRWKGITVSSSKNYMKRVEAEIFSFTH